jgi:putative ABC transport system permease protein
MRRAVPLKYNLRSLQKRIGTSVMTVLGVALGVWASVVALALLAGLQGTLEASAGPLDLVVLRQGARTEVESFVDHRAVQVLGELDGVATTAAGTHLVSPELVAVANTDRRGGGTANVIVRGVTPDARALRRGFRIVEGRNLTPGVRELIASRRMAARFVGTGLGETLPLRRAGFEVVGLFEADGTAAESEVWADLGALAQDQSRVEGVSAARIRAVDAGALDDLKAVIANDERLGLKPVEEGDYYAEQAASTGGIAVAGMAIAALLTLGSIFAEANTMHAAVASRTRELGTLRALGYSRLAIFASCMVEALVLSVVGGILGCLAALPLDGLGTGTVNWSTLSEVAFSFRVDGPVLLLGMLFAVAAGVLGGMLPAIAATRVPVAEALRRF